MCPNLCATPPAAKPSPSTPSALSPGIPLVLLWFFSHAPQLPLFNSGWAKRGGLRKGEGSVEKFFSFARTHRKRYFIEFFVAQSESAPKIVVGTKFSISFSILVHLPATVATAPPPAPRRLLLIYFVVGKFFLRTLLVFVGFA